MIVQLQRRNPRYPDLSPGHPYVVIGIEANDYRLLNDKGRPFLYSASLFRVVDDQEPSDWLASIGDEGERYAYPPLLNAVGFFEDFFDNDPAAVSTFWRVVNERLAATA